MPGSVQVAVCGGAGDRGCRPADLCARRPGESAADFMDRPIPTTMEIPTDCLNCGICQQRDRQAIVGFPAHGSGAKRVQKVFFMKPMPNAMTT